jgi:hypothetical protein
LRPLPKIPNCCLPQESGPCLSPSLAGHPLRPATDRRPGGPSPHQLANRPRAPPPARRSVFLLGLIPGAYAVLAPLSEGYPPPVGRSPTCYSAVRHCHPKVAVRLACFRHAASVDPEPGSNSPSLIRAPEGPCPQTRSLRVPHPTTLRLLSCHRPVPGEHLDRLTVRTQNSTGSVPGATIARPHGATFGTHPWGQQTKTPGTQWLPGIGTFAAGIRR